MGALKKKKQCADGSEDLLPSTSKKKSSLFFSLGVNYTIFYIILIIGKPNTTRKQRAEQPERQSQTQTEHSNSLNVDLVLHPKAN